MPLSPHRDVTDDQMEACRRLGYPPPPIGSEQHKPGVFDFRHPGENPRPDAPASFRWRFDGGHLTNFVVYGWRPRAPDVNGGRRKKKPVPTLEYGILPSDRRYEETMKLIEDREV